MHIYRRQARSLAWYDAEGEASSHNPFKKFRARPRRSNSIQLESRLAPIRTADEVRSSEERRRRRDMTDGLSGPEHSLSFPPESSGTDHVSHMEGMDRAVQEPSMHSTDPINVPQNEAGDDEMGKPRKRKHFLGKEDESVVACNYAHVDPVAVFVVNFIAIIPLAAMLSYATEEIALRTGDTIGGLLNASFGNAVELIVAIIALVDNKVIIVQTSLIGSMLSNLLLVLGMCFLFGGVNRLEQHFNVVVAQTAASLLALAVGALIIPTAFHDWSEAGDTGVAPISRGTSVILLVVYGCYLFFQLKTHAEIYNAPSQKVEKRRQKITEGDASLGIAQIGKMTATLAGQNAQQMEVQKPEEEPEEPQLHIYVAVLTLVISTAFVGLCAEFMVDSIDAITARGGISETFVGLILLPIVGNAAEHATAVTVACKDKMDLSIGVAVGSSNDNMTLYFDGFQVILLFVSVLLVNYLIADGKSHWLEGVLLMMMYLIIAVAAWFYPTKEEFKTGTGK
ncbi:hypothetical protein FE257_010634 [Aspergillus nanangensis]|uniref:Sodium/calcium exchanger membrane region domain-containing protein n=1 Tax=Aspergillus nanangensis TaxID=2582783 RepID=A0AAD4CIV6_ASPNN|nr:hypothetical protein FE257_010634 [Aspergillus nanangensis]